MKNPIYWLLISYVCTNCFESFKFYNKIHANSIRNETKKSENEINFRWIQQTFDINKLYSEKWKNISILSSIIILQIQQIFLYYDFVLAINRIQLQPQPNFTHISMARLLPIDSAQLPRKILRLHFPPISKLNTKIYSDMFFFEERKDSFRVSLFAVSVAASSWSHRLLVVI